MAVFAYQGTGRAGERLSGEIEASTPFRGPAPPRARPHPAAHACRSRPTSRRGSSRGKRHEAARPAARGRRPAQLSQAQVILFTDELADFLHSGLQLEPALHLMENREERSPVKAVAAFLREKVRDGVSFSEALKMASPNFGELYCNLVAAGEVSGALAPLLRRQAEHLIAMQELRGRIKLALIYPAFLVAAGIAAHGGFHDRAHSADDQAAGQDRHGAALVHLPADEPRQVLATVRALRCGRRSPWCSCSFSAPSVSPAGRRWWDEAKLKLPLFGPLLSAFFYAQFCQTMANLLLNGLPLLHSLKLMSRATGNVFFHGLGRARDRPRRRGRLAHPRDEDGGPFSRLTCATW